MSARNRNWTFAQFWQGLAQARVSLYLSGFFRSVSQCFRAWRCGLDQSTIERLDVIKNADLSFQTGCDEMLTAYRELREEQEAMKSDPGKQKLVQDIEKMINLLPMDRRIHCWVSENKQMSLDDVSEQGLLLSESDGIKKAISEIVDNAQKKEEDLSKYIFDENLSADKNNAMDQVIKKSTALRELHQDLVSQVNKKDQKTGKVGSHNTGASFGKETVEIEKKIKFIRTVYGRDLVHSHDVMDGFSITNRELDENPFAIQKALVEGILHRIQHTNVNMNDNDQKEMTALYKQLPQPQLGASLHVYLKKTEAEAKVLLKEINDENTHNETIWVARLEKQKDGRGDNGKEVLKRSRERGRIGNNFQKMIANVEEYQQLIQDSFIQNDLSALHALLKKGMKCVQEGNDRYNEHTSRLLDMMEEEVLGLSTTPKSFGNRVDSFREESKHTKDSAQEQEKKLSEQENRNTNIHGNSKPPNLDI